MNYNKISDPEINSRVTVLDYNLQGWEYSDNMQQFYHCGVCGSETHNQPVIDYCNEPNDMWPIIELIWGELNYVSPGDDITEWDSTINKYGCGKLRAAAIVFLKMQDAVK